MHVTWRTKGLSNSVFRGVYMHVDVQACTNMRGKKQLSLAILASYQTTHPCLLGAGMQSTSKPLSSLPRTLEL